MDYFSLQDNSTANITESSDTTLAFTPFIWPPTMFSNLGMLVLSLLTILGTAGGIGGAGINIPVMMIFFGFSIKESVPLANIFGFTAALVRFIVNFSEKHPNNPERTVIDYEVVSLSMPLIYLGTLYGVRIGQAMTDFQVLICLMVVLAYVIYTSTKKGIEIYKKENVLKLKQSAKASEQKEMVEIKSETRGLLDVPAMQKLRTPELEKIIEREGKHFQLSRMATYLLTLILLLLTSVLAGNKYQKEPLLSIEWAIVVVVIYTLYSIIYTIITAKWLRYTHFIKTRDGYKYDKSDFSYKDNKSIFEVVILCFIAGVLGGIVGIAGGILLGPLLLQLGMLPVLVASTNQYLAMISTISVTSQFIYMDVVNIPWTLWCLCFQVLSAYIGVSQSNRIVKLTGRQSVIVFLLVFTLVVAFFALPMKYFLD